ncbi:hypothetical protein ACFFU1_10095 [Algibacter miyuki]|uniref:DUF4476 domain-containing protein n=1 Tax=Algibacter miyuki TaxID=1306933 RepID=A0ABV5H0D9_9FLAO|nr:hypothetical protein [Algibacter miyuki]MDN3667532.1 hypothetical protein [Algibacter miyuki]
MRKILLIATILISSFGYAQSEKITIKSENLKAVNYLKADDFYVTHYLYIDLFLRENLFPMARIEDVSSILNAIKTYVSVETPLEIEIEKPGDSNYLIKIGILKKDDGTELLIAYTNWNTRERLFEKDIDIKNDSYTRWYFLNGNKMTYRQDMSDKSDYSAKSKPNLAQAYLMDELPENDGKIKSTIDDILKEKGLNISDKILANLVLLKYHMYLRDSNNVVKQAKYLNELFKEHPSDFSLKGLEIMFRATEFQIQLMK